MRSQLDIRRRLWPCLWLLPTGQGFCGSLMTYTPCTLSLKHFCLTFTWWKPASFHGTFGFLSMWMIEGGSVPRSPAPIGWKWWNDFLYASLVQIQKFSHYLGAQEVNIVPMAICSSATTSNQAQKTASVPTMEQLQSHCLFSECLSSTFICECKLWTKVSGKQRQLNGWSPRYSIARLRFERLSWSKSITKPGQSNVSDRNSMDAS